MLELDSNRENIYFTADTHYWHKNLCYGESVWKDRESKTRRFDSKKEMSRHIVNQFNEVVGKNDYLFHLGDWSYGGINNIWNFYKQLNCNNIFIIFGNHDHHIINNKLLPNCVYTSDSKFIDNDLIDHSCYSPVNAQDLFVEACHYLEIKINGKYVILFHYPLESWNKRNKGSYMLHGHTHTGMGQNATENIQNRIDVGIDNYCKIFGEYKPFSWKVVSNFLN